jgi:hypothetical protein
MATWSKAHPQDDESWVFTDVSACNARFMATSTTDAADREAWRTFAEDSTAGDRSCDRSQRFIMQFIARAGIQQLRGEARRGWPEAHLRASRHICC